MSARRTRLYQAPGSPLIQGQSKSERPWWHPWLAGVIPTAVWALAGVVAITGLIPGVGVVPGVVSYVSAAFVAVGGMLGAYGGVMQARAWGWRRQWPSALAAALAVAVVLAGVSSALPGGS